MVNKVILIGNLTRDIELITTTTGKMVGRVGLATNKKWKDGNGQSQEKVAFHNLVFWDKSAQIMQQYTKKGDRIYVEGELDYNGTVDQQTGQKRYFTSIIVRQFFFLNSKQQNQDPNTPVQNARVIERNNEPINTGSTLGISEDRQILSPSRTVAAPQMEEIEEEISVDDIPF